MGNSPDESRVVIYCVLFKLYLACTENTCWLKFYLITAYIEHTDTSLHIQVHRMPSPNTCNFFNMPERYPILPIAPLPY